MRVVVAITGASGIRYGVRLLECLSEESVALMSSDAARMCEGETGLAPDEVLAKGGESMPDDQFSPLASGSSLFDAMVVCPCSVSTMSKIACGIADNLVTRVATVALKERRKLVLVIRETPLSTIHLQNLLRLSEAGVAIMPASPAFYPRPESVDDMVDFVVGRVLDLLGIEHDLYSRWSGAYDRDGQR